MIVVDASVLTNAVIDDGPLGLAARAHLARDREWAAPLHLVPEVFSSIRGRHLGGHVTAARCTSALAVLRGWPIEPIEVVPLLDRMWELRHNVSGYDAAYIAAAERYDCALMTTDRTLAAVPGVRCEIRLALLAP